MLAALVHCIVGVLRKGPHSKIELCYDGKGHLEVREALSDTADALSPAVRTLWLKGGFNDTVRTWDVAGNDDILEWEDEDADDFTACSASCDYCGLCGSARV